MATLSTCGRCRPRMTRRKTSLLAHQSTTKVSDRKAHKSNGFGVQGTNDTNVDEELLGPLVGWLAGWIVEV
jgi:hypothetical protein